MACSPNQNDLKNSIRFEIQPSLYHEHCKSVVHTKCQNLLTMVRLFFFFRTLLKTKTVKTQDKAHTPHHSVTFIQSPIHPPITKDIKSMAIMAMCCHFSLHSWLYIEGYAAVMTLRDGVVF